MGDSKLTNDFTPNIQPVNAFAISNYFNEFTNVFHINVYICTIK